MHFQLSQQVFVCNRIFLNICLCEFQTFTRRLVARTIAQQLRPQVEAATAPFQYALSTRAGSECVAHVIHGLCEVNPDSTVMSMDGLSACDHISRAAMLDGLYARCGGKIIPFVRMFLWLSVHVGKMVNEWSIPFCREKAANREIL